MSKKILVTYASKAGSTAEVANAISQTLGAQGNQVDAIPVRKVATLEGYDQIVLGSAIRASHWLPEALNFLKKNQAVLSQKPVSFFTVCLTLSDDTPENRKLVEAYLTPVRTILEPISMGFFAGKMDPSKLNFIERMIIKAIKAPSGDFRNWEAIEAWAKELSLTK